MIIYMAVSADKYELPLYIADTLEQMANIYGVTTQCVYRQIKLKSNGVISGRKFVKVEIKENDNE